MVSDELLPAPIYELPPAPRFEPIIRTIAPPPAPRVETVVSPRGTFGPKGHTDIREVREPGPSRGFASRIRRAKAVSGTDKGSEAVTYV